MDRRRPEPTGKWGVLADKLGSVGVLSFLLGIAVWYLVSRHLSVALFGVGMLGMGLETAIKRHSPGGARSAALQGTTAVLVGLFFTLAGAALLAGAIAEWVRPGLF